MTMQSIKKLSNLVIDKISVGETINSFFYLLKELLENSIDAHSNKIIIFLENDGLDSIKIIDNGIGIYKFDLLNLCQKFYSSKIKSVSDLENISTYGFKGQSLFSIYNICNLKISSRPIDQFLSWQIVFNKLNKSKELIPCFHIDGTIVDLYNLNFFSKYKSKIEIFNDLFLSFRVITLSNFNIHFILFRNGIEYKNLPQCNDNDSKNNRIKKLFEHIDLKNLFNINFSNDKFKLTGFISFNKSNINVFNFFYVNKRFVFESFIDKILLDICSKYKKKSYFLFYCLYVDISNDLIDFNIDSKKCSVKFKSKNIYSFIFNSVSSFFFNYFNKLNLNIDFKKNILFNTSNYNLLNYDLLYKNIFLNENKILAFINNLFIIFCLNDNLFYVNIIDIRFKIIFDNFLYQFNKFKKLIKKSIFLNKYFYFDNNIISYTDVFLTYGFVLKQFCDNLFLLMFVPNILYNYYINWYSLINDLLNYFKKNLILMNSINKLDLNILNLFVKNINKTSKLYEYEISNIYTKLIYLENFDNKWFNFHCKKIVIKNKEFL